MNVCQVKTRFFQKIELMCLIVYESTKNNNMAIAIEHGNDYSKFLVGCGRGKTEHGISLSLIKSALQKYIRRGETEKAIGCLHETNTLLLLENANEEECILFRLQNKQNALSQKVINQFGKAQRTNIANRLLVMVSEEVNIHDHPLIPVYTWELYNLFIKHRNTPQSIHYLASIAVILSNAKKGRIISYLKSAFNLPPFYVKESKRRQYNDFHSQRVLAKFADIEQRSSSMMYNFETFINCFESNQIEKVFRCIGKMCENKSQSEIKKLFKNIWEHLLKNITNRSISALYEIYNKMTHLEKPLYLYHALLLKMYHEKLNWDADCSHFSNIITPSCNSIISINEHYVKDHHVCGSKNLNSYIKLLKESFYVPEHHMNRAFIMTFHEELYRYIKLSIGHYEENKTFPSEEQLTLYIQTHFE